MSRIGGAFPLPIAQLVEGGMAVTLASGGVFFPPPGVYCSTLGTNTIFEAFDPIAQIWRQIVSASDFFSVDGYNFRLRNTSGTVSATTITGAGSGGTNGIGATATGASLSVAAGSGASIPATLAPIVGGSVQAPTISQAGTGFLVPPLIVIDPPPAGGIQATAVCTLTGVGGGIASVSMVNVGAGYAAAPNFWIIPQANQYQGGPSVGVAAGAVPPPGLVYPGNAVQGNQNTSATGALLTPLALTGTGTLTGAKIIYFGNGYTGTPTVSVGGVGAATVTVTVGNTSPVNDTSYMWPRVQ
jgi:hypothetical protein